MKKYRNLIAYVFLALAFLSFSIGGIARYAHNLYGEDWLDAVVGLGIGMFAFFSGVLIIFGYLSDDQPEDKRFQKFGSLLIGIIIFLISLFVLFLASGRLLFALQI